jgi:hypothetical protein
MPPTPSSPKPPEGKTPRSLGLAAVLVVAVGAALLLSKAPVDRRGVEEEAAPTAEPTSSTATPSAPPPRCSRAGTNRFRIGKNSIEEPSKPEDGSPDGADEEDGDLAAAFGAEVSRANLARGGFAVGVRLDTGSGAEAGVALVDAESSSGKLVDLGRSRGDFDAPLVAPVGEDVLVALLEPNASGGTLRVGALHGEAPPRWTVELDLSRDESLAFDLATGPKSIVVAWDDVTKDGKLSRVVWAGLDARGERIERKPSVASGKSVDAESPRVVARPGGFWLAYIARKQVSLPKKDDDDALDRNPKGDRYAAEKIDPSWLELLPLDEAGAPIGSPRALTEKSGHVLTFDLSSTAAGEALLAWRDDDTPSGSHGGRVSLMAVPLAGGERTQLVAESDVGSGSPTLLGGWVAVPNAAGLAMLAPLGPDGALAGDLRLEPSVGAGDPLFAKGEAVLVATSVGTAIDLLTVTCKP